MQLKISRGKEDKYRLLTEFEGRTVKLLPAFLPIDK